MPIYLSFSYDTEQAVPDDLPRHVIAPDKYKILDNKEKKALWANYLRDGIWVDHEHAARCAHELDMIERLAMLFETYSASFTSFILGRWLDFVVAKFGSKRIQNIFLHNAIDVQSHSYNHNVYKTTNDLIRQAMSAPLDTTKVEEEILHANDTIKKHLGFMPIGLRTPMGNLTPFDKNDAIILGALAKNNMQFVSSWLKKTQTTPNMPHEVSPLFYNEAGYPDILEIPAVGYFDVHFTQPTRLLVFDEERTFVEKDIINHYLGLLKNAIVQSRKTRTDVFVPLVFHPWAVAYYDPKLRVHKKILEFCTQNDIKAISYSKINQMMRRKL